LNDAWLAGAVALIVVATLPPQAQWEISQEPLVESLLAFESGWSDVVQNVALYVPFGLLLAARGQSLQRVCAASAVLSLATELAQSYVPGRYPSASDVFINTCGAALGYAAISSDVIGRAIVSSLLGVQRWAADTRNPSLPRASRLLVGWALLVGAVLTLTAVLLMPAPPANGGLAVSSPVFDRPNGPLRIGSNGMAAGYFKGTIDEVRIYSRVRTENQIRADMGSSAARANDSGVEAAYTFDSDPAMPRDDGDAGDAVFSRVPWTKEGRFGGALIFDGVSSEILLPHRREFDFSDAMTLEAWVRPSGEPSEESAVIAGAGSSYYVHATSSLGRFEPIAGGRFGAVPRYVHVNRPIPRDEWTHLAATFDGESIRLYVNGTMAATRRHWSPHRPLHVSLNGSELSPGPIQDADRFRTAILDDMALEIVLTCGRLNDAAAPVFLVVGMQSKEILALNARGHDLLVQPFTRAARVGLAAPPSIVSGAFGGCTPGERLALTVNGRLQDPRVARGGQQLRTSTPGLGSGWALLIRSDLLPAWAERAGTLAWLAALAVPFGLWARPNATSAIGGALAVVIAFGAMRIAHVRAFDSYELLAVVAGTSLGALVRRAPRLAGAGIGGTT
jgi:hypothetical protein